jgi:hypothetical protein
VILVFLDQ